MQRKFETPRFLASSNYASSKQHLNMSRPSSGGPKLPASLLDTFGAGDHHGTARSRNYKQSRPASRKDQRKAFRVEKKQSRNQPRHTKAYSKFRSAVGTNQSRSPTPPKAVATTVLKPRNRIRLSQKNPSKLTEPHDDGLDLESRPSLSRAVKAKLDEDDAEIAALEKKLGVKGKAKPQRSLQDADGFDALLNGLDDYANEPSGKRKRSDYGDFLASKRRQADPSSGSESEDLSGDEIEESRESQSEFDEAASGHESIAGAENSDLDQDMFNRFGSDSDTEDTLFSHRVSNSQSRIEQDDVSNDAAIQSTSESGNKPRENPYMAPVSSHTLPNGEAGKYIPPSMRISSGASADDESRLRRQLKGLLNRLSESNIQNIMRDVESIYAHNARQHVTAILINLLMDQICDRSTLMDTFVILHAAFATAVYRVVGSHFGAQLLERIVKDFDRIYSAEKSNPSGSKEPTNLVALLAELYTFQVIGANVVFDYIRLFLANLSEINTELLLKIIQGCGSQLRHDDPTALKDIVILLQKSVAKAGEEQLPVRTKFMIETINDLKNNRLKAGAAASIVAAEQITRLKKTLATIDVQAKSIEPLGIGLVDIRSSAKEGKWWLVGASWRNEAQSGVAVSTVVQDTDTANRRESSGVEENVGTNLLLLAKEQRMNTDIRRAIFLNIMSAEDFKDAHTRLLKLKLKKSQELEIPRVLIHCAGAEQSYNPYYTLIAKQLCSEHRFKWAMQYGLWDLFKRLGEKTDGSEDMDNDVLEEGGEDITLKTIVNLGRLYGQLVADGSMSLASLKVIISFFRSTSTI